MILRDYQLEFCLIVSDFMSLSVSSSSAAWPILSPFSRSSSILGSVERSIPMVFVNTCWLERVFQLGTLDLIEWSSASSFILASKRLSVTPEAMVLLIDL